MTALKERLAEAASAVTAWLDRHLQPASDDDGLLLDAMRHMALAPGKRLRPFLTMTCAGLFGVSPQRALPTAAAIECLHAFSLIHDDLPAMDDSPLRRGRPTCHVLYGEALAILAGDALQAEAFAILTSPAAHENPAVRCELACGLARAVGAGGMVLGQALDMLAQQEGFGLERMRRMQRLKTGELIAFSCKAGAILAGAGNDERQALHAYGHHIGLLFQIIDDLLDVTASSADAGKPTGQDAAHGKATFIALTGVDGAQAMAARLRREALGCLDGLPGDVIVLRETVKYIAERTF